MRFSPQSVWVAAIISVLLLVAFLAYVFVQTDAVELWGYRMSKQQVGDRITRFQYKGNAEKLVIIQTRDMSLVAAERMINERVFLFGSLFEPQRVGYKGQHTEYVECDEQLKPTLAEKEVPGGNLQYFTGYANNRFVPGACDQGSIAYSFITAHLYCPEQQILYDIEYFFGIDKSGDSKVFIDQIDCGAD